MSHSFLVDGVGSNFETDTPVLTLTELWLYFCEKKSENPLGWDHVPKGCEECLCQAFPFDILKKTQGEKKIKTQGKNSITQGKNSRFCQLLLFRFRNSYFLITFTIIWACFWSRKIILCRNSGFSSKTQQNSIQFV